MMTDETKNTPSEKDFTPRDGVLLHRGALSGAIVGGLVGSIIPGVGTVVGAGLGAWIGHLNDQRRYRSHR